MKSRRSLTGTTLIIILNGALTTWERIREFRLPLAVREQLVMLRRMGAEIRPLSGHQPLFHVTLKGWHALLYGAVLSGGSWSDRRFSHYRDIKTHGVAIVAGQPLFWALGEDGWRVVHGMKEDRARWREVVVRGLVNGSPLAYASDGRRWQPYLGMTRLDAVLPEVPFGQQQHGNNIDFEIADNETGETQVVTVSLAA